ncbi:MAG: CD225/dispanin family protein [Acidimicrobiia bacterium]
MADGTPPYPPPPYGTPPPPPPPGYGGGPYGGGPYGAPGPKPDNNLVWAILSTVLCCLPLGIASIVFASQVDGKWAAGDFAGAREASDKARKFAILSAGLAAGLFALFMLFLIFGTIASNTDGY